MSFELGVLIVAFVLLLVLALAVTCAELEASEAERRRLRDVLDTMERIDDIQLRTRAAIRERMNRRGQ